MPALTIYLSRLLGVVMTIIGVAMLADKSVFVAGLEDLGRDGTALFLLGMARVVIGAAIVLTHNFWNRGFWPLIVTLTGWAMLVRGVMNLVVPAEVMSALLITSHAVDFYYVYAAVPLLLGAYLGLRGFSVSAPPLEIAASPIPPSAAKPPSSASSHPFHRN